MERSTSPAGPAPTRPVDAADAVGLTVLLLAGPGLLACAAALLQTGPSAPAAELTRVLGLGAGLAGLGLLAWWAVGLIGLALVALGRRAGRPAWARLGRSLTPALLGRVAGAVVGAQLLAAPAAWADAAHPVPDASWTVAASPAHATGVEAPAPDAAWTPRPPAPAPPGAGTGRADPDHPTVTVRRGDCLWHLAAAELGPDATPREIDARWRRWYEANRRVIGDDPHLLLPGTVLSSPVFAPHAGVDGPRP
ncbi:Uncharacterised protein [Micrococcus luteus]|uniref:LysM peptidoglycan-binding domain-containing protein n=1 Tax=Micrococcus luteus TaxID=1270 RepID=UPI000BF13BED|nr:hypothetical protein [Micrococcus luteus]PEH49931.1 hypothetical protein CRM77_00750 [Micrococcus luteus]STY74344.1 Uncharacterised protein [Micrococcus luteus]